MSKSSTNRDRRETVERMRAQAKAAERRRTLAIVAVCAVVALIIVGVAGYTLYQDKQESDRLAAQSLSEIGTDAQSAGCAGVSEEDASGAGQHTSEPVSYSVNPPSFGPHNPTAAESGTHMYTVDDRPEVEMLVHNLEHGWTIVWYDQTVADDDAKMKLLEATAKNFDSHGTDPQYNLIIAPWTSDDGNAIPQGKHIALTHWSIHQPTFDPKVFSSVGEGETLPSFGESQYCSDFSGAVVSDFTKKYPYDDAPEGFLWHQ